MDNSELRAAADRIRRINAGVEKSQDIYGVNVGESRKEISEAARIVKRRMIDDERMLVDFALATVHADDDEPVTGHACQQLGMRLRKTALGSQYWSTEGTLLAWHPAKDQWFLNGGSVEIDIKTMGQLRSLLTGLGIELKGGA